MEIRAVQPSEVEAARRLLVSSGWERDASDPEGFRKLLSRSQVTLVAVEGDDRRITWVLRATPAGVATFYEKLGFTESEVAMERPRARSSDT